MKLASPIAPHTVLTCSDLQFQDTYLIECRSCKSFLFQLSKIQSLLIWNQKRYLVFDTSIYAPETLIVDDTEKVEMEGIISHNIYVDVKCEGCKGDLGLVITGPHFMCQALAGKLVVFEESIKCFRKTNKGAVSLKLEEAFDPNEFEDVTSGTGQGNVKQQENSLKQEDIPQKPSTQQDLREQLKHGIMVFQESLEGMEQRINRLEAVCSRYNKVIKVMFDKLGLPEDLLEDLPSRFE